MFSALPRIPHSLGVSRIIPSPTITCLLGDPQLARDEEHRVRIDMLRRGLVALQTPVQGPTAFA